jgi:hypothetical protein
MGSFGCLLLTLLHLTGNRPTFIDRLLSMFHILLLPLGRKRFRHRSGGAVFFNRSALKYLSKFISMPYTAILQDPTAAAAGTFSPKIPFQEAKKRNFYPKNISAFKATMPGGHTRLPGYKGRFYIHRVTPDLNISRRKTNLVVSRTTFVKKAASYWKPMRTVPKSNNIV